MLYIGSMQGKEGGEGDAKGSESNFGKHRKFFFVLSLSFVLSGILSNPACRSKRKKIKD